jgi:hypothetical protein
MKKSIILLLVFSCMMDANSCTKISVKTDKGLPFGVSLIKLISNPELYDKKCVAVSGVYRDHGDEPRIYLDHESYLEHISSHSFTIGYKGKKDLKYLDGKRIFVIGTFSLTDPLEDPSGVLEDLSLIQYLDEPVWESDIEKI